MHELMKEYRNVQRVLVERLDGVLSAQSAELLVLQMEHFAGKLEDALAGAEKKHGDLRDENTLLRSLLNAGEGTVQARLIEATEEVRFLRGQLTALNREFTRLQERSEKIQVQAEQQRQESENMKLEQRCARERFEAETELFNQRFLQLQEQYNKQVHQKEAETAAVAGTIPAIAKDVRHEIKEDLRQVGLQLRALSSAVVGSSQYCMERWEKIKEKRLTTRFSKWIGLDKVMRRATGTFDDLVADLALIKKNAGEMISTIDTYVGLLDDVTPVIAPIDLRKLFDDARRRCGDAVRTRKLVVTWPNEKKYPLFASDAKLIGEIVDILIANALEAAPPEGSLAITGMFSDSMIELRFVDNGSGVAPADVGRLFKPFYSTKTGHAGLGLYRARRCAAVLGGLVRCDRVENVTVFVLRLPHNPM